MPPKKIARHPLEQDNGEVKEPEAEPSQTCNRTVWAPGFQGGSDVADSGSEVQSVDDENICKEEAQEVGWSSEAREAFAGAASVEAMESESRPLLQGLLFWGRGSEP